MKGFHTTIASKVHPWMLVFASTACERLPEVRYETAHLRVATDFDEPLCQGDLEHYERVITTLEDLLATAVEDPVDVYLWDLSESFTRPDWCTNDGVQGCFQDGSIYASQASIDHELVHAVVASFAAPAPFWSEGAAVTLQSEPTYFDWTAPVDNLDLDAPYLNYSTAGHFSRWLLETQGAERYRMLLRAPGNARQAFEQTYDMDMKTAQEQYFAEAPSRYPAWIACDHPPLPSVGELQWADSLNVDCAMPDVRGTPNGMGAYRVLTITQRGHYEFSTTAEAGVISRCDDDIPPEPVAYGEPNYGDVPPATGGFARGFPGAGAYTTLELIPGQYEISAGYAGHEARTASIEVRASAGPVPITPESSP